MNPFVSARKSLRYKKTKFAEVERMARRRLYLVSLLDYPGTPKIDSKKELRQCVRELACIENELQVRGLIVGGDRWTPESMMGLSFTDSDSSTKVGKVVTPTPYLNR